MKNDYPEANARLAEVAKNWADGEVSHEMWRKERRSIISSLLTSRRDWLAGENKTTPPNKRSKLINATLPSVKIPQHLLASADAQVSVLMSRDGDVDGDVLLLAVLLLVMILTAILLLYVM